MPRKNTTNAPRAAAKAVRKGASKPPTRPVLEALYRISRLPREGDADHALARILDEVFALLPATSASIALINPDTARLEIEAARGLPAHAGKHQLTLGQGVTGWVALHGKPLRVPDVTVDLRYYSVKASVRSEMAVPLEHDGAVIGVVNVDSDVPDAFSAADERALLEIAAEATHALTQIWKVANLRVKSLQLESLITAGQKLVSKVDTNEILDAIAAQARTFMECRYCAIFLLNPDGQSVRLAALAGAQGHVDYEENLRLEDSTVGVAILRRKQVEVLDLPFTEEHHFIPLVQQERLVSFLCSPMTYGDKVIGILNVYTGNTHRFSNDERRILAALASLGAAAIENSQLYSRVFSSEESLRKNERLTTLGLLAAEIAHEIRNPLTVIKLLFDSLDLQFPSDDARTQDVSVIREKLDQLGEIVERVLTFGKSQSSLHSRWNVELIVEDTLRLVRLKLAQCRVHLEYRPPEQELYVEAHKGQFQQVLLNLIINALQAMPKGGHLSLAIGKEDAERGPCASITISDTGTGVPERLQPHMFDSILMPHKEGGLGLSIVKRILKSHRGDIELVRTGPGGTTFRFWLPRV